MSINPYLISRLKNHRWNMNRNIEDISWEYQQGKLSETDVVWKIVCMHEEAMKNYKREFEKLSKKNPSS